MNTTTQPTYVPRTGSLSDRVLAYFRQQPDEELTSADIASKFEVSRGSVMASLQTAVSNGALEYTRNTELEFMYRLPSGAAALTMPAAQSAPENRSSTRVSATGKRGAVSLPASALDFSGLKAETGVPVQGKAKTDAGDSKWAPLFALLSAPDTSVEIPAAWKSAVAAQATKQNVRAKSAGRPDHYVVRLTGTDTARVWRTA